MINSIFIKTLYDKRWFTLGWSIGLFALGLIMILMHPAFTQGNAIESVFETIPKEVQAVIGDAASLRSIEGYIASQVFDLRVPLITIIMAIALFYSLSASEEKKGTLQMLSILPISRGSMMAHKFLGALSITLTVFIALLAGILLGLAFINESISLNLLLGMCLNAFLLTILAGTLVYMLSLGFGLGGASLGLTSALFFTLYLLFVFSLSIDWLESLRFVSPFSYNNPREVIDNGYTFINSFILLATTSIMYVLGLYYFNRRDLS